MAAANTSYEADNTFGTPESVLNSKIKKCTIQAQQMVEESGENKENQNTSTVSAEEFSKKYTE